MPLCSKPYRMRNASAQIFRERGFGSGNWRIPAPVFGILQLQRVWHVFFCGVCVCFIVIFPDFKMLFTVVGMLLAGMFFTVVSSVHLLVELVGKSTRKPPLCSFVWGGFGQPTRKPRWCPPIAKASVGRRSRRLPLTDGHASVPRTARPPFLVGSLSGKFLVRRISSNTTRSHIWRFLSQKARGG